MIDSYFKGFLVSLFILFIIIFIGFLIIGSIILSVNCYISDTIMDMPGYCALVL